MSSWDTKVDSRPVTWFVIGTVFLLLFCWVLAMGLLGLNTATAGLVGKAQAHIQTQGAAFRLTAYNMFFDRCVAIQNAEAALEAQSAELLTAETPTDRARINTNISANLIGRASSINQYNQDALKWTVGQFRDTDLPYSIPNATWKKGATTTCAFQ